LVQGFKSRNFELQTKDIWVQPKDLGSRKFEFNSRFEFKGKCQYFQRIEFDDKDFDVLSDLEN
jgi:hypothetical protein